METLSDGSKMPLLRFKITKDWELNSRNGLAFFKDYQYQYWGNGKWYGFKSGKPVDNGTWRYDPKDKSVINFTNKNGSSWSVKSSDFPSA
jgi:hypothetical protein